MNDALAKILNGDAPAAPIVEAEVVNEGAEANAEAETPSVAALSLEPEAETESAPATEVYQGSMTPGFRARRVNLPNLGIL